MLVRVCICVCAFVCVYVCVCVSQTGVLRGFSWLQSLRASGQISV